MSIKNTNKQSNPMKLKVLNRFLVWRIKHLTDNYFMFIISIIIGILTGLAAIIMKNSVHFIQNHLHSLEGNSVYLYIFFPIIGLLIVLMVARYILRFNVGHGIPGILYAISRENGKICRHNIIGSLVTSIFTVGFGGSVGLEGPAASTGAAIGSNLGQALRLNYKQTVLLIGCGATGAIAAIFNTPVAAIVFSLEVLMLDLSVSSLIPLLLSSVSALVVSYFLLGQQTIWAFDKSEQFILGDLPFYILLGIFTGLCSVYFTKLYIKIEHLFDKIKQIGVRLLIGGLVLGLLVFLFPPLYGEGYEVINYCLHGKIGFLFEKNLFTSFQSGILPVIILLTLILLLKPIATCVTFGGGGVGGIFAPALFFGAIAGLLFAFVVNVTGVHDLSLQNSSLVGMAGIMAGILHAPLTAIFLIADVTKGYELIVPLMITSIFAFATTKIFVSNSVYTFELARRNQLITHNKDKSVLSLMKVDKLLETNFAVLKPNETLGDLVQKIRSTKRNVFPVTDENNNMLGIITLNDVRDMIFRSDLYNTVFVEELMYTPESSVQITDTVEQIAKRIHDTGHYNIPVLKNQKYMGFISRANVFATYQKILQQFSDT